VLSSIHRAIAKLRAQEESRSAGAPVCNQALLLLVLLMMDAAL
jgi:hypothetical protein